MSQQSSSNQLCSQCQSQPSTSFCKCQDTLFFLCISCLSSHTLKFPHLPHQIFPIDVRYADEARFQQTCEQYAKGKREIQRSIEGIDRCSRELTEAVNGLIEELGRFRDQECEKLREIREKLEKEANEAMEEVEKTLSQDDPMLKSDLAKGLRNYQPGTIPSFTFDINVQPFQIAISSFFTYTIVPAESNLKHETPGEEIYQCGGAFVPYLHKDKILFFDCVKQTYSPVLYLLRELKGIKHFAYVLVGAQCVISCGGLSSSVAPTESAFSIEAGGRVNQLADLRYARYLHGIIYVKELKAVFLFGGLRGSAATVAETPLCEGLSLAIEGAAWVPLPNMSVGRKRFSPCWYLSKVYLCGSPNPLLEAFDPFAETMTVFPFHLQEQPSACIAYVHKGQLMVISDSYVSGYEGTETGLVARRRETHKRFVPLPSSAAIVVEGVVYVASEAGVIGLNAESGERVVSQPL